MPISNNASLAVRLLRVVLAIYLSMAIILTLGQLALEYQNERKRLTQEVENVATTFAPIISKALWSVDEEHTKVALQGVLGINNDVLNVKLLDTSGSLMYEYSATEDKHRLSTQWPWLNKITKPFLEYYVFEYKLSYQSGFTNSQSIGTLILASNSDVVLNRAAHTFLITILSAVVKTSILSLIFYFIVRSMVGRPLLSITNVIQSLTPQQDNQPRTHTIDPDMLERSDELGLMARSFIKMTRALQQKDEALNSYSQDLEAKVQERTAQLEQVSQAKSNFLAAVSHEIRTPMNGVIGLAHLLSETELSDQQRQFVTTIQQSGESLTKLINEILDHLKLESNKIELEYALFNPEVIMHESAALFIQQARQIQVPLSIIYAADCPSQMEGDPVRLRQILVNLLGNAFKFTQSGRIIIKAEMVRLDRGDDNCQEIQFSIIDTGIGIDDNQLQRLFKPFSQADSSTTRRYGGTGLGLAICKQLVELMGGAIGVNSRAGEGSIFWFKLPARKLAKSREVASLSTQDITVYLCMADDVLRQHLQALLLDYGVNAQCIGLTDEINKQNLQENLSILVLDMAGSTCRGVNIDNFEGAFDPLTLRTLVVVAEDCLAKNRTNCFGPNVDLIAAPFTNNQFIRAVLDMAGGVKRVPEKLKTIKEYADYSDLKVLVAEDIIVNQMVILGHLKKYSIDPVVVDNGSLAVDYCKDNRNIDLILMDGEMPEMDGWQAAEIIRKLNICSSNNKSVVIVAMTAHAVAYYEEKAAQHGMDYFLSKPIRPMELESILAKCMEHAKA